jgi:simple sugar transport system permease protein
MFADDLVAGRGFIAVALVYFGRWTPLGIAGGALLFSLAQALQLAIQVAGIKFPYEFAVMLPYALVIVVLALARRSRMLGPAALGKPYDREVRV